MYMKQAAAVVIHLLFSVHVTQKAGQHRFQVPSRTPRLFMGATVYAAFCNACPGLHRRDSSRHHAVLVTTSVVVGTSILGLIVCGREPKKPIPPAQPANQSPP